jgi:homoserine kinase
MCHTCKRFSIVLASKILVMVSSFTPFTLAVPATSANLGPGFDSLGMAVNLFNRFTVSPAPINRQHFSPHGTQNTALAPVNPADSLFFQAMAAYQAEHPSQVLPAVDVTIEANIPLSRGLGSSSTVVVAGLLAACKLLNQYADPHRLLPLATRLEGHPDNVAPALLGGVQLCQLLPDGNVLVRQLPWPKEWQVIFIVPPEPLSTHVARQVMPQHYPLGDAVANVQACAMMVHALHTADEQAMAAALADTLHQPYRIPLISAYRPVAQIAAQAGALGTVISGAGSTMAVFVTRQQHSHVARALDQWIGSQTEKACKRLDLAVLT